MCFSHCIRTRIRTKHKIAALVLAAGALAACTAPRASDGIVIATERPPLTLDPRFSTDTASENAVELVFNGLLKVNGRLGVEPDLAESFEIRSAREFVFHLRPGIRFQNGRLLTSEDAAASLNELADEKTASPFRSVFRLLKSAEAQDARTVLVKLKEDYAFFPLAARRPVLPREEVAARGEKFRSEPVGTGPFELVSWDERSGLKLKPFAGYFGGAPKPVSVHLKPTLDANMRVLELLRGKVDLLQNTSDSFPPGSLALLKENPDVVLHSRSGTNVQYLNFNLKHPVLRNPLVRRAIAHAVDREGIVRYKLGGFGRVATGILPPIHWAYEPDVPRYAFDAALARRLLDEAGYPVSRETGKRFRLTYRTSTNPQSIEIAEVIRTYLEDVGIGVTLRSLDFGVLLEDAKRGNFDIYTMQWTSVLSPDHHYEVFHSKSVPPAGYNRNFYSNAEMDGLLEAGRKTVDPDVQKRIYSRVQKIVAEDLPCLPLWYPDQISALRKNVSGYSMNPRGTYDSLWRAFRVAL